ncbi:MAG: glycosyltransferase family 2 protein, partial [Planctomycetota bacterium]
REYVIVDNGSSDNTREVVEEFAAKVSAPVHYVFEEKAGHSFALNSGCRKASGGRLVFTDDDTLPDKFWLQEIDKSFRTHNADWVFGPIVPKWEHGDQPWWYGERTAAFIACLDFGDLALEGDRLDSSFFGANHACSRDKIFELGLYDEELGLRGDGLSYSGNDIDLYQKAREVGMKVIYLPLMRVQHIIAKDRYLPSKHRRAFWKTGRNECLAYLREYEQRGEYVRFPRFRFPKLAIALLQFGYSAIRLNRADFFYWQVQVIRHWSFIWMSLRAFSSRAFTSWQGKDV